MSRLRHLARNISSGYLQVAANAAYTLASVPLALHYLSKEAFALWALVSTVVGYLMLVDAGITAATVRVLIDHKDKPEEGAYGTVFKTSYVVLLVQGILVAAMASVVGLIPGLFDVPADFARSFQLLLIGHGIVTGVAFPFRIFGSVLYAHQRLDIVNHTNTAGFAVSLGVLWFGFSQGFGLYSLLAAYTVSTVLSVVVNVVAATRLRLLPPSSASGRFDRVVFKELFAFASDLLLLVIGLQLINYSQVVIITRTIGLEAAAVWVVATKGYSLAQQFVWRLWDFSASAISEMFVRAERDRVRRRFMDLFVLTASLSVFAGIGIAACNENLLAVWTNGRISWGKVNDVLLAILFVTSSTTRLHVGLTGTSKRIHGMRYVYFLEGVSFVVLGFIVAPMWGTPAVIACSALMNMLWTGVYGTLRTARELDIRPAEVLSWLKPALRVAVLLAPVAVVGWRLTQPLSQLWQLIVNFTLIFATGALIVWRFGLTPAVRMEFDSVAKKMAGRLGLASR